MIFLDVSKIESSLLRLSKTSFELNDKIKTVLNDIELGNDNEGNNNKILFEPKELITIFADRDRIYQVLYQFA